MALIFLLFHCRLDSCSTFKCTEALNVEPSGSIPARPPYRSWGHTPWKGRSPRKGRDTGSRKQASSGSAHCRAAVQRAPRREG